jgi:apolipoprotein N-acyltransferase
MKRAAPFLAAIVSGLAVAITFPTVVPWISLRELDPAGRLELVAWVALVPALLALRAARSARGAFALGLVAGFACFFPAIHWVSHAMTAFGGLSTPFAVFALSLLVLFMAAHWGGAFAVAHVVRARLGVALPWVLPVVWAAFELLRNHLFTGFPWGNLGYTQARALRITQLAALGGVYLVAALVALVNAAVAEAVAARREGARAPRRALAAAAALVALALVHGEWRLRAVRARMAAAPAVKVGIVQPNVNQAVKNRAASEGRYILERLVPLTVDADEAGAGLVVWPEAAYPFHVPLGLRTLNVQGAGIPRLRSAHLLAGMVSLERVPGPDGRTRNVVRNSTYLATPDLDLLGVQVKNHLVPFGEYVPLRRWLPFLGKVVPTLGTVEPSAELNVLAFRPPGAPAEAPEVTLAPLICFDAIFPEISVAYARRTPEPELLVNPTNDAWYGYSSGPYQFLAIVRMRAVETGKAVVRPAYAGVSAVILPTGEVAPGALEVGPVEPARAPDPEEPARLLLADVPRLRGSTPYTRVGDLFAGIASALAAAALGLALLRRRASGPKDAGAAAAKP